MRYEVGAKVIPRINKKEMGEETKLLLYVAKDSAYKDGVTMTFDTVDEAIKKAQLLVNFRKRHEHDQDIWLVQIIRRENVIYLVSEVKKDE